jgi:hypothetical protein
MKTIILSPAFKPLVTLLFIAIFFLTTSCQKQCRTCICETGEQTFTEKNCAMGNSAESNLDNWEEYLRTERHFKKVTCTDH